MPRTKRRAPSLRRHLDAADVARIVMIIEGWETGRRIVWEQLADRVAEVIGHRWTRQALERSPVIKQAYLTSVDRSRAGKPPKIIDPAEVVAKRQADATRAEIDGLKRKLAAYEELFVRHHHNAQSRGISAGELGAPMPSVDRRQTDGRR